MLHFEPLDDDNFELYAAKCYDSPHYLNRAEFEGDLQRFRYIKKLVTRYTKTGELKERYILNHLIILCNVFGPKALPRMIFLKMKDQMSYIKPFLVLLNIMPEAIYNVNGVYKVDTNEIAMDAYIVSVLRKI